MELTWALPHNAVQWGDGLTGRVGGTALGYDSQACQRDGKAWIRFRPGRLQVSEH
jgi:hypothetical protein